MTSAVLQRRDLDRTMDRHTHRWSPITDLPENWRDLDDPGVRGLVEAWKRRHEQLRDSEAIKTFNERLRRAFAIETGQIEGIYDISPGATITLIEHGLDANLLSHGDTNQPAEVVIEKIKDQHSAIVGVYQFVSGDRVLSKSYIRELHQVVTAHQPTYAARDSLGTRVERAMLRGQWKQWPNNLEGEDGFAFEFSPPEQVDSEIDRLLELHERHNKMSVSPIIKAAWLHHRFVQIHPFCDGNGRVARCLTLAILLKGRWLPLVIRREDKAEYCSALRVADHGDLQAFIHLAGKLQKRAIQQALSVGVGVVEKGRDIPTILESAANGLRERKHERLRRAEQEVTARHPYETGMELHGIVRKRVEQVMDDIRARLRTVDKSYGGGTGGEQFSPTRKAIRDASEVADCAKRLGYFANFDGFSAWANMEIDTESRTEILFSFHEMGHGATGVVACVGFMFERQRIDRPFENGHGYSSPRDLSPLSEGPFTFTADEPVEWVRGRFADWMESCLRKGLERWESRIV